MGTRERVVVGVLVKPENTNNILKVTYVNGRMLMMDLKINDINLYTLITANAYSMTMLGKKRKMIFPLITNRRRKYYYTSGKYE